jgi:cell division protein FtsA
MFTDQLATSRNVLPREAERIKMLYSEGKMTESEKEDIALLLAPAYHIWIDTVEAALEEITHGEVLPSHIFLVGGGVRLPDIQQKLESYPWYERLPFELPPDIALVQPSSIPLITDNSHFLRGPQEVPVVSLAFQTIRMQHRNDAFDLALTRVVQSLRL